MALSRVQATPVTNLANNATITVAFSSPPTVGNAIIVAVAGWTSTFTTETVTDNYGNAYALAVTRANGNPSVAIFWCDRINASGTSFTISIRDVSSGADMVAGAVEVAGATNGLGVATTVSNVGTSTTPTTGSTAALADAEVFVAAICSGSTGLSFITVESVSPAWTQEFEHLLFDTLPCEADTRVLTSAVGATTSCSWTYNTSTVWATALAAFRAVPTLPAVQVTQQGVETLSLPKPAAVITQAGSETLSSPFPAARPTQFGVETLSPNVAPVFTVPNVSQYGVETLSANAVAIPLTTAQVTQAGAEVLTLTPPPTVGQVTQVGIEVLTQTPPPTIQVTQAGVETLSIVPIPADITQAVLETFSTTPAATRETQTLVEVFRVEPSATRTTQAVVEYLYPVPVYVDTTQAVLELRRAEPARTRLTQAVVELLYLPGPGGCPPIAFPIDSDISTPV